MIPTGEQIKTAAPYAFRKSGRQAENVLLYEPFNYVDGELDLVSGGNWSKFSALENELHITNGKVFPTTNNNSAFYIYTDSLATLGVDVTKDFRVQCKCKLNRVNFVSGFATAIRFGYGQNKTLPLGVNLWNSWGHIDQANSKSVFVFSNGVTPTILPNAFGTPVEGIMESRYTAATFTNSTYFNNEFIISRTGSGGVNGTQKVALGFSIGELLDLGAVWIDWFKLIQNA